MPKFRKLPITVEAEQFHPEQTLPFASQGPVVEYREGLWWVQSANGPQIVSPGDWVVLEQPAPGLSRFAAYPIKPDVFAATYDPVED